MKILEIIALRSTASSVELVAELIAELIAEQTDASIQAAGEAASVAIYRRSGLETDLALHIHHGDTGNVGPSALGLRLAAELGAHGLVVHTLWEEQT